MKSSDTIKILDEKIPSSFRQIESLLAHRRAKNPHCPARLKDASGRVNQNPCYPSDEF
jgi:hypothetical protein